MEVQANREFWEKLIVTLGAEYRDDFRQNYSLTDVTSGNAINAISRSTENHGIFLQGDWAALETLRLNAGVRYDQYGNQDPGYNPRVALIYNPWKESTFKAIYGTAFRAPNFYELFDSRYQDIKPETITSYELIYDQGINQHLHSTLSVFRNELNDLVTFSAGRFQNFDNATAEGFEVGLDGSWSGGLRSRLSYTRQETEDSTTGLPLPEAPRHLIKAGVTVPVYQEKVFGSLEVLYTSTRPTLAGNSADAYTVVNFTLFTQKLLKGLEFSGSVYNLFGDRFFDPARPLLHRQDLIERDGRSFRLKMTYAF